MALSTLFNPNQGTGSRIGNPYGGPVTARSGNSGRAKVVGGAFPLPQLQPDQHRGVAANTLLDPGNPYPQINIDTTPMGYQSFMIESGRDAMDRYMGWRDQNRKDMQVSNQNANTQQLIDALMGGSGFTAGAGGGNQPNIHAGPAIGAQDLNRMINANYAQNQQGAEGAFQNVLNSQAGRGMRTTGSPILAALRAQLGAGANAASSDYARNMQYNTAMGNAQHTLSGQQAREGQYSNRQREQLARMGTVLPMLMQLLNQGAQG